MKYIDIHGHVHFSAFDEDRDEVVKQTFDAECGMISVGTQKDTSLNAVKLANKYPDKPIWAIIGLHPIHTSKSFHDKKELDSAGQEFTSRGEEFDYDYYKKLGADPKVVGIGEVGLDYYRLEEDTKDKQKQAFEKQIELANDLSKSLMLHTRNGKGYGGGKAYEDVYDMIKSLARVHCNVHCFTGDWETAKKFLDLGCTLSFTGMITFTRDYDEVVKNTPLDMLMAETDCPYISPEPHRGKRNEPMYVKYVFEKIAEIKGLDAEEVREALIANSKRVFNL
ncbi:MAG: TatD family hydrolase [Parcubacteria group bacterium]